MKITLDKTTDWTEILHQLTPLNSYATGEHVDLYIEYTRYHYLEVELYPIIAAYVMGLKGRGVDVDVHFDLEQDCDTVRYAGRMGFFDHLGIEYSYPNKTHDPSGRFIPLTRIEDGEYDLSPEFTEKICQELDLNDDVKKAIIFSIGEMISNITQHAESPQGGILFGQYFPKRRETTLILVDPGVGIHEAFKNGKNKEYHGLTEAECLRRCIDKGVTCGDGRGHGLFLIQEIISRNLGTLRIISGNHHLSIVNGIVNVQPCNFWQGTLILCEFQLNNKIDLSDILVSNGYEPALW